MYILRPGMKIDEYLKNKEKLTTAATMGLGGGTAPPAGGGVGAAPPAGGGGVVGSSPLALSPPSSESASSSANEVSTCNVIMTEYHFFTVLRLLFAISYDFRIVPLLSESFNSFPPPNFSPLFILTISSGKQGWLSGELESPRLPPMWPGFNSLRCLVPRVFLRVHRFSSLHKPNLSNFQFDLDREPHENQLSSTRLPL